MKSLWPGEQIPNKLTGGSCTHWAAGIDPVNYRQLPIFIFFLLLFICFYAHPKSLPRIITIAPRARTVCFCLLVQLDIELHICYVWEKSFQVNCSIYCSNLAITRNDCIEFYLRLQRRSLCLHHLCPSWWISAGSHCSKHLMLSRSLHWHLLDAGLVYSLLSFKIQERTSCVVITHLVLHTVLTRRIPLWLPVCQDLFCPFWLSCKGGECRHVRESTAAFLNQVQSARIQSAHHLQPKEFLHSF